MVHREQIGSPHRHTATPHAGHGVRHVAVGWFAAVPLCSVLALFCGTAQAHPLAPAVLELRESASGRVDVIWKTPLLRAPGATAEPVLPVWCQAIDGPAFAADDLSVRRRWTVDCGSRGLVGGEVGVRALETMKSGAFVRITKADGSLIQGIVSADRPLLTVPERARVSDVVGDYVVFGVHHILAGPDHLLFVFGLLLLARSWRRVLQTVTAFTVGHSITLSVAVLGIAVVPQRPAELAIALTVFALAVELSREPQAASLMRRFSWGMAIAFGLLHGLGFAAALRETGLPAGAIPLALFSFNVGIELGQVLFVLAVGALWWALRRLPIALPVWVQRVPVYVMGSLAALWCFERAVALW